MTNVWRAYRDDRLPRNYFRAEVKILRWCGLELAGEETPKYALFSKASLFFWVYFLTFLECYELYAAWGADLNSITNIINYSVTHVIGSVKIVSLYLTRDKYKRIMVLLHEGLFEPDINRGGEVEKKHVRDCVRKTENMLVLFSSCVLLVYVACVAGALRIIFLEPRERWKLSFLPISIVDTTYFPMFELAFLFQNVAVFVSAYFIVGTDLLRCSIIGHLSCQFKILRSAFKNIKKRAVALSNSSKGEGTTLDECFEMVLGDSIDHHLGILRLANEMEELCSMIVLFLFITSGFQLCFMLYQASLETIGSVTFVQNIFYWLDIAVMVFLYCYFGDEVSQEASNVATSITEMDWTGASVPAQKALILVIARAQKPLYVTAGKFFPLSLETFMAILKASFSYFTVVRQVNAENAG